MQNRTKFGLSITIIAVVIVASGWFRDRNKCGDGICQKVERIKGSCPKDCPEAKKPTSSSQNYDTRATKTIKKKGGRLDWSHVNNLVLFDKPGNDGYYDVYIMNPDGSGEKCITCNMEGLPQNHNGNPAWHPSGEWIVFQSVDLNILRNKNMPERFVKINTNPGAGPANEIWIMDKNYKNLRKIHNVDKGSGVLHPHFSDDGRQLTWSQLVHGPSTEAMKKGDLGVWSLKVADFKIKNGTPVLENVKTYQPGHNPRFYESHGFTLDGKKIFFSGNPENQATQGYDVCVFNLETQEYINLTNTPNDWDEHSNMSPDGKQLIWMSSQNTGSTDLKKLKADFWLMNIDGTNKKRITFFNDPRSDQYLNIEDGIVGADSSWSPDGKKIMVHIKTDRANREGPLLLLELE